DREADLGATRRVRRDGVARDPDDAFVRALVQGRDQSRAAPEVELGELSQLLVAERLLGGEKAEVARLRAETVEVRPEPRLVVGTQVADDDRAAVAERRGGRVAMCRGVERAGNDHGAHAPVITVPAYRRGRSAGQDSDHAIREPGLRRDPA